MTSNRLRNIDAGRGTAMLFVLLSHFAEEFFQHNDLLRTYQISWKTAMIASPSFMLISGMMLGFLFVSNKNNFNSIKLKLIDKGLFLLIIAHFVILLSHWPLSKMMGQPLRWAFITDAIGINIIVGPLLINKINKYNRLFLGISLFIISWLVVAFFDPISMGGIIIKESIFGSLSNKYFIDNFAILPWFSLYLIGSSLGEKIGRLHLDEKADKIEKVFLNYGLVSAGLALLLKASHHFLFTYNLLPKAQIFSNLFSLFEKNPPGPVYLLFYGGLGLLMLYTLSKIIRWNKLNSIINTLEMLGKTSLFTFILQYIAYFSILVWLNLSYPLWWPAYFIFSVIIIVQIAKIWHNKGYNRFFTILNIPIWKLFLRKSVSQRPVKGIVS